VTNAPRWAEGNHRPSRAPAGTWKPRPSALADFGHAIARRYSGHFRDPTLPIKTLPHVRYYQLWAEANLSINLSPQWSHSHPVSPDHYRKMLNAFFGGVKGVQRGDQVVTSGLAPYGDHHPGGQRLPPVLFWRGLLCLKGNALRPGHCGSAAHFDVAAHNPINEGPPTQHAISPTDASTPDLGRIKRVIRKGLSTGGAKPKGKKPLWATEIWWDSKPPDPHGVPAAKQARWLEQSFYVLWRQGASKVVWFLIRDQAPNPSFSTTYQSGLFLRKGTPKPAYRAYRFPFVADRLSKGKVRVWGEAPHSGSVAVQRKSNGHWRTLKVLHAGSNRVFTAKIRLKGKSSLRARQGGEESLPW
jgi:hypothetical protein